MKGWEGHCLIDRPDRELGRATHGDFLGSLRTNIQSYPKKSGTEKL